MNLYKTTGEKLNGDIPITYTRWAGTQSDAGKHRKELKGLSCKGVGTEEVDLPTKKPDLLEWLAANCT